MRSRLSELPLASRLAWLSAALTAIFVATTLIPLSLSTSQTTRKIVAEQLNRTQRALIENQERDLAALRHAASLIGQNARMRAAMADDRTQELTSSARRGLNPVLVVTARHELEKELANVDQDIIVIVDEVGRVFAVAARDSFTLAPRTDLSSLEAVKVALDPLVPADTGVYGVLDIGRDAFSVAAVPLVAAGRTLGVVMLGERIDAEYLGSRKEMAGGDVIVTAGDSLIGSTAGALDVDDLASLSAARGDSEQPTLRIGGEELVAAPLSLGRSRAGTPVTLWLLQPVSAVSGSLTRPIVVQFILYGFAAVVLSGLGAALVAQSVLKPLDRFIGYMKRTTPMAAPEARPDLSDASPEIRTLDDSFASLMTSLRESEAQLRQSQKLEAVGTLAGGVAHDFNNLLTVITGYTELAMMRNPGDAKLKKDLTQVVEASQRAARLTHQLLAFSRKQLLQPTALDINEVVGGIVPMLRRLIGEHIRISVEPSAEVETVVADRGQLEQVIINLVVNARDAMPAGGRMTIRTGHAEVNGERRVTLSVSDTGTGIPDAIRDRIFEPFFTTKELGKGTGLGLSMVHGIINQSGGTISVQSAAGQGTTFTITLPASAAPRDPQPVTRDQEVARGNETILLVEDEPELRELARRTLESFGYEVIAPEHTEDALAISISRKVDLLLTDIVMPVMSGPTIVKRLTDVGAKPVVVYMTGYADETLAEYRLEPGATLLRKPFSPSHLARTVRSALDCHPESVRRSAPQDKLRDGSAL